MGLWNAISRQHVDSLVSSAATPAHRAADEQAAWSFSWLYKSIGTKANGATLRYMFLLHKQDGCRFGTCMRVLTLRTRRRAHDRHCSPALHIPLSKHHRHILSVTLMFERNSRQTHCLAKSRATKKENWLWLSFRIGLSQALRIHAILPHPPSLITLVTATGPQVAAT